MAKVFFLTWKDCKTGTTPMRVGIDLESHCFAAMPSALYNRLLLRDARSLQGSSGCWGSM